MSQHNTFGQFYSWTTFGESHGEALGVVIDGCPAGVPVDLSFVQAALDRRRPGQRDLSTGHSLVSDRDEADRVELVSGVFEGKTIGTPITCFVRNKDARSQDYSRIPQSPRRGHADDSWRNKFGHSDHRGGGRSSGRETICRVIAGSIAQQMLKGPRPELKVSAFVKSIGSHQLNEADLQQVDALIRRGSFDADLFAARFPTSSFDIASLLLQAKDEGESYGGVVEVWVDQCPAGLGEPVFYKLKSVLASAMMSIGATCGFEIGNGFRLAVGTGTEVHRGAESVYGGIRGGISTGERLVFRVAFKPTSSILDIAKRGRHDPCIVPRAVPVVEAMTWSVLADFELARRLNQI